MNPPTFTGAFIIGDVTYRVTDAYINSISVNTFPSPICITSHDSLYEQYIQPYLQTEITLKMSGSKIIMEVETPHLEKVKRFMETQSYKIVDIASSYFMGIPNEKVDH